MEYPLWQLATTAGGFWIALVSILHVYVAQFAVGGGLFLVLTERSAYKRQSGDLLEYVRKHSKFFLLLSMVFGAVTGVGIWFTIALTSPQATIVLIHNFLFAWATEWTFFLGEIVALLVYYYGWKRLSVSQHLAVGWIYFVFGWLSLFMINGILAFMLTPGQWLETKNFWDGFFNPSFWPQLWFRTFICLMLAGLFGFVTATRIPNPDLRARQVRICSLWTLVGVALMFASGYWYLHSLPAAQYQLIAEKSARVGSFMQYFLALGPLVLLGGLALGFRLPRAVSFPLALLVLLAGLGLTGSFEFMREAGRKPYLIWDHLYSNSILKAQVPAINAQGMLKTAKWVRPDLREITEDNRAEAGAWLYELQCSACHSRDGVINDIRPRSAKFTTEGMDAFLSGMGAANPYMPPFAGTDEERRALAFFLTGVLHPRPSAPEAALIPDKTPDTPEFDAQESEYVLLAWARQGMRLVSDTDRWILPPPGSTLRAQLFRRDSAPEAISDGVEISFEALDPLPPKGMNGVLKYGEQGYFEASGIPVLPYETGGGYNPVPVFKVTARDAESNEVLAETLAVLPASTRMGCMNCHGAQWRDERNGAGISESVAGDVLAVHDRRNRTDLAARAASGAPVNCRSCHAQDSGGLELSAALHGFHAAYLSGRESDACALCHPLDLQRDPHKDAGITCVNCHGTMENHALSLLKAETGAGRDAAVQTMARISPRDMTLEDIEPRKAWKQQPDCLTCHEEFAAPGTDTAANIWVEDAAGLYAEGKGDMGAVLCASCHGSPHATYPAMAERDNLQPLQYTGEAQVMGASGSCTVCHIDEMEDAAHHPGMGLE
ncbi:multiheme c-type cytochrome [Salidesulfovibrio onnuriiensis]|uniref:multiheme c-type cytochrome n=1 Tax=Salidesulfovibrio onnuriiensis TaxID=2583823 RepID=UPI0011CC251E|nr:cytochrome ubiquinol oxidase subunit I [Salidesulfovibrio onnuriiensis]